MVEYIGQKLGNYRLVKLLGRGGFADVYLGEHIYLQTPAAIKVLQMRLTDEALGKFLAEARTIARFSHPNIVSVLEFGIENATPFLVMSYAPYGSLRERHPRGSLLLRAMIVSYVEQVATALQYALATVVEDGYISHTVAVPFPGTPGASSASAPPSYLAEPLPGVRHVSRRRVIAGLVGLTGVGLVTVLGAERLLNPLFQPGTGIHPKKPKAEAIATPNISATAMALINAAETSPAAVSWGSNRIDIFARSTNNTLAHKWFDGGWSDWEVF